METRERKAGAGEQRGHGRGAHLLALHQVLLL